MAKTKTTTKTKKAKSVVAINKKIGKKKPPPTNGFKAGNQYRFPPGQSGNPSGRPKLLSSAYKDMLGELVPDDVLTDEEKGKGIIYAELIARTQGQQAIEGSVQAAREIRSATEGERIRTWRDDILDLIRSGALTQQEVIDELGEEVATELIIAGRLLVDEGRDSGENGEETK